MNEQDKPAETEPTVSETGEVGAPPAAAEPASPEAAPVEAAPAQPAKRPMFSWHTKMVGFLTVFLPVFFMVAALGSKVGLWSWQTGLGSLTAGAGPWLIGLTAVVAVISLGLSYFLKPRRKMGIMVAILGLIVPLGMFGYGAAMSGTAGENPIHDVATDTANPPAFSAETMAAREAAGANVLNDYQTPLGELEMYAGSPPELAIKSHAQIINDTYAELSPLPLGGATRADAVAAVAAAMGNMGFENITTDVETGRVEGLAVTFWYGFEDDVVARIGEQEIDFRSVSRVGRSDLGANAARIAELRERVAQQIGQR